MGDALRRQMAPTVMRGYQFQEMTVRFPEHVRSQTIFQGDDRIGGHGKNTLFLFVVFRFRIPEFLVQILEHVLDLGLGFG